MSIPVLMYHHVLPCNGYITIGVDAFEKQMRFLSEEGYHTLSLEEFFLYKTKQKHLPHKSVLLTFDDGWHDNFIYAYPILKKYNLRATIFVVTEWVELASQKNWERCPDTHHECTQALKTKPWEAVLSWNKLRAMQDVFDIASHTHTHVEKNIGWQHEFSLSKHLLKTKLNIDNPHLCWPRGYYDKELITLAKEHGYSCFYTTDRGINTPDNNLDTIKRISIKNNEHWLRKTLAIFSSPFLGAIYSFLKK